MSVDHWVKEVRLLLIPWLQCEVAVAGGMDQFTAWTGIGGRVAPEWVINFAQNTHTSAKLTVPT